MTLVLLKENQLHLNVSVFMLFLFIYRSLCDKIKICGPSGNLFEVRRYKFKLVMRYSASRQS